MNQLSAETRGHAPIGVFDSGLGGLTVAAAMARALPHEHIIYLGDTARVPYGTRSPATVVRYARKNAAFLKAQGVKLVVVACNTVSAHALGGLADGAATPVLGVIRPGARAALEASCGGAIAVLGTPATIRSDAYVQAIHEAAPGREVIQIACPLFVPLAEEGRWLDHPIAEAVAQEYLAPLAGTAVDTIVLGCTHYPLLEATITRVARAILGRDVAVVDSATSVALELSALLERTGQLRAGAEPATRRFYVTDAPQLVEQVARRFWGDAVGTELHLEHVDVVEEP